jgi:hypothetical protein
MKTVSGACGPRADDAQLLVPEQAALAGVRVQPGHADARPRLAPQCRRAMRDAQRLQHGVEVDRLDRTP